MTGISLLTNFGAAEQPEGIAALGIDPLAILAQLVTFLVLFWIVKRFALDSIVNTLEKRRKTIDDGVRLGREMEAAKEQLDDKVAQVLKKARIDADEIIAEGHQKAGEIIKQAEGDATRKVDAMLSDAHAKIDEDIDRAKTELEQEMRELVAEATEVILGEKLNAQKDATLLTKAINKVRAN